MGRPFFVMELLLTFVADDRFLLGVSNDRFQLWPVDLAGHLERLGIRVLNPMERIRFGLAPLPLQ